MSPLSTTSLSVYETLQIPQKIFYFLPSWPLSWFPLTAFLPTTFSARLIPLLSLFLHFFTSLFSLPHCLGTQKCQATDIQMMMPWIWCPNAILPLPCSLHTSPPPTLLCREGGSLRETLAYNRICSHLKFPSGTAAAFSSPSEPSNLLFFSSF